MAEAVSVLSKSALSWNRRVRLPVVCPNCTGITAWTSLLLRSARSTVSVDVAAQPVVWAGAMVKLLVTWKLMF